MPASNITWITVGVEAELGELAARHEHRGTTLGQSPYLAVELLLGADVDAPGGFVERAGSQRLG